MEGNQVQEIKVQVTLKGEVAEKFAASMERNYRSIAGEAAFRIAESLSSETLPRASVGISADAQDRGDV